MDNKWNQQDEDAWMIGLLQRNLDLSIQKGCTSEEIENARIELNNWIQNYKDQYGVLPELNALAALENW